MEIFRTLKNIKENGYTKEILFLHIKTSLLYDFEQQLTHTHTHTHTHKLHFISISSCEGANMKNEFMQMSNNPTSRAAEKDCVQNKSVLKPTLK